MNTPDPDFRQIPHRAGYYRIDAINTNDFSRNKSYRGIKAGNGFRAVRKLEERLGFPFDRRWDLRIHRSKDLSRKQRALRKLEKKVRPRSPWAALARHATGPRKRFSHAFDHHLNLAYECIMDRAMRY